MAPLVALATGLGCGIADTNPPPQEVSKTLRRLHEQLDEQTRRLDRLYRLFGPHLDELEKAAAESERRQQEDQSLALDRIREVADDTLTSVGCVNPTTPEFAVITAPGSVRVFNAAGEPLREFKRSADEITCLAYSPDGAELLCGTQRGGILVWDMAKGTCSVLAASAGVKVDRLTWIGCNRIAWGGYVKYWQDDGSPVDHDKAAGAVLDRATGRQLWTFRGVVRTDFDTLAGARDGKWLVVREIPGEPRGAFVLDGDTGKVLHTCYDEQHGCGPLSVAISPDGNILAVGYAPYDIILWNVRTGERCALLEGHSNWVVALAFSADSRQLISGSGDGTARIWDIQTGKEIGRLRFEGSPYVEGVGLSPKGDVAFASMEGRLVVAKVAFTRP